MYHKSFSWLPGYSMRKHVYVCVGMYVILYTLSAEKKIKIEKNIFYTIYIKHAEVEEEEEKATW